MVLSREGPFWKIMAFIGRMEWSRKDPRGRAVFTRDFSRKKGLS